MSRTAPMPFPPPEPASLKLWSVVVTIMGDFLEPGRREISGPVLSALVGRMGFQPEALRVALHRLKRDGWIASRRAGRIAHYRLTDRSAAETGAVRARVYGTTEEWQAALGARPPWALVIGAGKAPEPPALELARGDWIVPGAGTPAGLATAEVSRLTLSEEARALVAVASREAEFADLARRVEALSAARGWLSTAPVTERAAQRVVVLHLWRRLVLLSNPVAEALAGPEAAPAQCREAVRAALDLLPVPDMAALESAVAEAA